MTSYGADTDQLTRIQRRAFRDPDDDGRIVASAIAAVIVTSVIASINDSWTIFVVCVVLVVGTAVTMRETGWPTEQIRRWQAHNQNH